MAATEKAQSPQSGTQLSEYTSGYVNIMAGSGAFMTDVSCKLAEYGNLYVFELRVSSQSCIMVFLRVDSTVKLNNSLQDDQ